MLRERRSEFEVLSSEFEVPRVSHKSLASIVPYWPLPIGGEKKFDTPRDPRMSLPPTKNRRPKPVQTSASQRSYLETTALHSERRKAANHPTEQLPRTPRAKSTPTATTPSAPRATPSGRGEKRASSAGKIASSGALPAGYRALPADILRIFLKYPTQPAGILLHPSPFSGYF